MSLRIFIAHSPRDVRHYQALYDFLVRLGFQVWRDPAPTPDLEWKQELETALRAAQMVMVIVTPNSATSPFVTYEWATALALGIRVVPILFQAARAHPRLMTLERYDVTALASMPQFWEYFHREVLRIAQQVSAGQSIPPPSYGPPASYPPSAAPSIPAPMPSPAYGAPTTGLPFVDRSIMPDKSGHWIVIRKGPTPGAFMFRLHGEVVNLGRDAGNDIAIDHGEVSRNHIRFLWKQGGYALKDMGSTNGTRLNGMPIAAETMMSPGAIIQIGETIVLTYEVV